MIPVWLTTVSSWFVEKFGSKIVIFGVDKIRTRLQSIFASRNILILGDKQTGKTSLISYLTTGKPYEINEGKIHSPEKTDGYLVVDKRVSVNDNQLSIKWDVAGESDMRALWGMAIEKVKPVGIIYMINGRLDKDEMEKAIQEIFDDVLCHYEGNQGAGLKALHVFVNFVDQWGKNKVGIRSKLRKIEQSFDNRITDKPSLEYLEIGFSATQFSPHKDKWREADQALFSFGSNLL